MILDELQVICNQLEDVENEVYYLDDELEERGCTKIEIAGILSGILSSLDIVIASVTDLLKKSQKEQTLIDGNENLKNLYKEYDTIRKLIGS